MSLGQTLAGILNATCKSKERSIESRGMLNLRFATVGNAVEVRAERKSTGLGC